jgi:penicillin-binding protein 1A
MTLTQAITRSVNVIPVKLSIAIGNNPRNQWDSAKKGRAKIVETARRFGIKAPLLDTPSLPIGSTEVNILEHAVAYATFPNKGRAPTPHAVLEVRSGAGELVWRWDRDGKKPLQAIPAQVAADMSGMMSHVVSEGTARRAALDGIPTAGKTGTTNAYRDAWFVGFTGNFTCAVWYGNDDYSPTNRMTGGSLPAQTWHDIMVAAHQGIEVKEIPGVGAGTKLPQAPAAVAAAAPEIKPGPPPVLTRRGADVLVRIEKALEDAGRAATKTSEGDAPAAVAPAGSIAPKASTLPLPGSYAAASDGGAVPAAPKRN